MPVKRITKRESIAPKNTLVKMSFDIPMLDALIKYMRCEFVSQQQKVTLHRLLEKLDYSQYGYNTDIYDRLMLLKVCCEAMCEHHIKDEAVLITYIKGKLDNAEEIMDAVNFEVNQLTDSECKMIAKAINQRMQCLFVYQVKDDIINSLEKFNETGFENLYDDVEILRKHLGNLMVKLQNVSAPDELIRSFNFSGEQ